MKGSIRTPTGTHTVGFLLVPEFPMIAFTSSLEPLHLANRISGQPLFAWRIYSQDGAPVTASNGMRVEVDGAFNAIGSLPEVIVCAGAEVQEYDHASLIAQLRRLSFQGLSIGAVCTGSYILAKAGLLDGYRCTIHWENHDAFREEFPDIELTQGLFEIDRKRFTCAGGTAAIDMMLALITNKKGGEIAALVTDELIHHRMREAKEGQRMRLRARLGTTNAKVLGAVGLMEKHLEAPLSCTALARKAGLSPRQLDRLFQRYVGETPSRYYLRLRHDRARKLLLQTSMPILSVGLACGFASASHFASSYGQFYGLTPSDERRNLRQKHSSEPVRTAETPLSARFSGGFAVDLLGG